MLKNNYSSPSILSTIEYRVSELTVADIPSCARCTKACQRCQIRFLSDIS